MKKLLALSAVALGLSTSAFANTAPTQQVEINGKVVNQTCKLDGNPIQQVSLGEVKKAELANHTPVPFSIKFKECDDKNRIFVEFDKNHANVTSDGYLQNTFRAPLNAEGVQIKILKNDDFYNLKTQPATTVGFFVKPENGNATFDFKATYAVIDGQTVTAGGVKSIVPVTLKYE